MSGKPPANLGRGTLPRGRPTFLTRAATDDASQLLRRSSLPTPPRETPSRPFPQRDGPGDPYEPATEASTPPPKEHELTRRVFAKVTGQDVRQKDAGEAVKQRPTLPFKQQEPADYTLTSQVGSMPRPVGGTDKLDTFSGVFVPTSLNVLSILMFLRFGFILGQAGVLGMLGMLTAAYIVNLLTTMSISAIASNGTVRGGGAYYLISRSLGPEFGGSIGIVFYLGFVFNTGMNAVGLIDCLSQNFGSRSGNWSDFLPESMWWQYLWATLVLVLCTLICLAGSAIFARASNGLLFILLLATISIPVSSLVLKPFESTSKQIVHFTGWRLKTLSQNAFPHFTQGAAGSQLETREGFQDLFGILFPATGGIFAGASMSGDLKNPSKSIPRGTLYGLALTFFSYAAVIVAMAASITRESLYDNVNIIQDTNVSGILILLGECASTLFSVLMGVIGPAKLLQAIARDSLIPGIAVFGRGTRGSDEPTLAILLTYVVAQITMLFDFNQIASFVTMAYLMTFFVTNLACFLLRLSSAPNFRPSFHYFNSYTAGAGAIASVAAMFFVDGFYATGCIGIIALLFLLIHFTTPPKSWGDVSQGLIYHQVRKYLLRLRTEHVKFWRPQILLFVNDPRRGYKLIQFCNSLKKGSLFILGHVIVTNNFGASVPEARRQQAAWTKYIDFSKIKAFINVAISPSVEYGTRNIVLSAGLGGMRPNIVVMGFYNLQQFRQEQPLVDIPSPPPERQAPSRRSRRRRSRSQVHGELPTDSCIIETQMDVQSYVMILEDMILKLQINVAIAVGFNDLELPDNKNGNAKSFIDLWPIQMSAEIASEEGGVQNVLTTNFDTYTMILQLGCILNTVSAWKKSYKLRVAVFVEYESDVEEERQRVCSLLENLRIEAEVLVFWLAAGDLKSYEIIVNGKDLGDDEAREQIDKALEDIEWWQELRRMRGRLGAEESSAIDDLEAEDDRIWQQSPLRQGRSDTNLSQSEGLRKFIFQAGKRRSYGNLSSFGISPGMRTHKLDDDLLSQHASYASGSEEETEDGTSLNEDSEVDSSDNDEADLLSMSDAELNAATAVPENTNSPGDTRLSSKKSSVVSSKSKKSQTSYKKLRRTHAGSNVFHGDNERGRSAVPIQLDPPSPSPGFPTGRSTVSDGPRSRASSRANFTSSPVPPTQVASEEGVGPSIMFAEEPHPRRQRQSQSGIDNTEPNEQNSSYFRRSNSSTSAQKSIGASIASGFPNAGSLPLSFNDLPSRAQHLILNELMTMHTEETAVVFTTLPAPSDGTYKNEGDSLSNSMTVTMNL